MELETGSRMMPLSVSPDGTTLIFERIHPDQYTAEVMTLSLEGAHKAAKPLIQETRNSRISNPTFSPDSRWFAYDYEQSEPQSRNIYVQAFPPTGAARYPITTDGGSNPRWSGDGRRLFYLNGESKTFF